MSFGLFVHKFDTKGKLFDGDTSDPVKKLITQEKVTSDITAAISSLSGGDVATAQAAAEAAQAAANTAQAAAEAAQADATTGINNASAAQTAANDAQSAASTAQTAADNAQSGVDTLNGAVTVEGSVAESISLAVADLKGSASGTADDLGLLEALVSAAQADATTGITNAATAQAAAEAAQADATTGIANAATAQAAANAAQADATANANAITVLTNGAPDLLNTLDELAAALGDDANFATSITNLVNAAQADATTGITNAATAQSAANTNATAIAALGNMSAQASSSVDIDGGAIDGTVIGGSSAAAGSFTTLAASSTLAVTGQSEFSANLFPNSATADVDLGGEQGTVTTNSWENGSVFFFEDAAHSDRVEYNASVSATYPNFTLYQDSEFSDEATLSSTRFGNYANASVPVFYQDSSFSGATFSSGDTTGDQLFVEIAYISDPSSAVGFPEEADRALGWDTLNFVVSGISYDYAVESIVWDVANLKAKVTTSAGQAAINLTGYHFETSPGSGLPNSYRLNENSHTYQYVEMTVSGEHNLDPADFVGASYSAGGTITAATEPSANVFRLTLSTVKSISESTFTDYSGNNQSVSVTSFVDGSGNPVADAPTLYYKVRFNTSWVSDLPEVADVTGVRWESGEYNYTTNSNETTDDTSITVHSKESISVDDGFGGTETWMEYRITGSALMTDQWGNPQGSATLLSSVGATELRYFRDINARRAFRLKTLGAEAAPTSNGSGDSAFYVRQCPVNYSGSHADELFYLDAAGNTVQVTEGGHLFAPRRAMDATEVLAVDSDLSALPVLASSLKEAYSFDLSSKLSPAEGALSGSSQTQSLTLPAPKAADIGREVKFIVLGGMGAANQLTINAGTFAGDGGSFAGQIDGLSSVVLSQPYQVVKLLAIKAEDSTATGAITCWKLV